MNKIIDRYKFDTDEIKRELFAYADDIRMGFDKALSMSDITEEQRLAYLKFASAQSAAIYTFLSIKAGIDIRTEDGGMVSDQVSGYFSAKMFDVEQRIKKSQGEED